jgi:hypothetical protein
MFDRRAITNRLDLADAIRRFAAHEKKLASVENGHSSGIVEQFEASQAYFQESSMRHVKIKFDSEFEGVGRGASKPPRG